MHTSVVQPKTE